MLQSSSHVMTLLTNLTYGLNRECSRNKEFEKCSALSAAEVDRVSANYSVEFALITVSRSLHSLCTL